MGKEEGRHEFSLGVQTGKETGGCDITLPFCPVLVKLHWDTLGPAVGTALEK